MRIQLQKYVCLNLSFLLILGAGCNSGLSPVVGRVVYENGSPVTEGTVIGEAKIDGKSVSVQGAIESDGKFSWGTAAPADGAAPGTYRVVVMPPGIGDAEMSAGKLPAVDAKFTSFETSGIEFEVKKGKNELNIQVTKPKGKLRE